MRNIRKGNLNASVVEGLAKVMTHLPTVGYTVTNITFDTTKCYSTFTALCFEKAHSGWLVDVTVDTTSSPRITNVKVIVEGTPK